MQVSQHLLVPRCDGDRLPGCALRQAAPRAEGAPSPRTDAPCPASHGDRERTDGRQGARHEAGAAVGPPSPQRPARFGALLHSPQRGAGRSGRPGQPLRSCFQSRGAAGGPDQVPREENAALRPPPSPSWGPGVGPEGAEQGGLRRGAPAVPRPPVGEHGGLRG